MSPANHRYRRAERLPWRTLDGQTVIVDPRTRQVHVLNGTASQLWGLLEQRRSAVELVAELEREGPFDVEPGIVLREVEGFLHDLRDKRLLVEEDFGQQVAVDREGGQ